MSNPTPDPGPPDAGHYLSDEEWARVQADAAQHRTDPAVVDWREPDDLAGDPTPDGPAQ